MFISGKSRLITDDGVKYKNLVKGDYTVEDGELVCCFDNGSLIVYNDLEEARIDAEYYGCEVVSHG